MIYRIITENKNQKSIEDMVKRRFINFTMYKGLGFWEGSKEEALIIEIDTFDNYADISVSQTAKEIKEFNAQEVVLVQKIDSVSKIL